MPPKTDPELGINSWLQDELFQQYQHDRSAVDDSWKHLCEDAAPKPGNGARAGGPKPPAPVVEAVAGEDLQPLRGVAGKIAENMAASVTIPLATSQRTIAVKVMDENRRIINQHRTLLGKSKVSYTHLIGWAIVKALEDNPALNHAYAERDGQPFRVLHSEV